MKKLPIVLIVMTLVLTGCAPKRSITALENNGFSDIKLLGTPFFACNAKSDSLFASYKFTAKNSQGKTVSGESCCGLIFKGCTIRF